MKKANVARAAFCAAMVALSYSAAAQTVSSFTVVNADTGADIATFIKPASFGPEVALYLRKQ